MTNQNNVELRWYKATKDSVPVLQYRKYYNSNICAFPAGVMDPFTAKWKWSEWQNVETFTENL